MPPDSPRAPAPAQITPSRLALTVVIPVYNAATSIGELVTALEGLTIEDGHEIVLVNDGSKDDSLAVCRDLVEQCRVPVTLVELSRNFGEHNAVMAGLRHAAGAHIITMDDDLQNPPAEVKRLLAFAQQSGHQVIYTHYEEKHHSGWRNLGSRFTNWVAGFVLDKPDGFYLSSFRCISAFVAAEITRYEGPFPYVDGLILQVTQDIDRLLVRHLPRAIGRSNYTMRRLLRLWLSVFINFSVMPLRLSTLTGFALSLIGTIGSIVALTEALFFDPPAGWASLMAAVLLLSGVQLVILGIVGEYIGRLYLTANRKPQSVVKSVIRGAPTRSGSEPQARPPSVRAQAQARA